MNPEPDRLTRRAALRGAAVAGAAALVRPGVGVASAVAPEVFSRYVGALAAGGTASIVAPRPFALVGLQWSGPASARLQVRTRRGGSWSPWVNASVRGHDGDGAKAGHGEFGEPIWTGAGSEVVQVSSAGPVYGVRVHFVAEGGAVVSTAGATGATGATGVAGARAARVAWAAHSAQALPLAQPILDAGPGQPAIIARAAWADGHAPPRHAPEYGTVKLAFVHHSESANGYSPGEVPSILRSIFVYHRYVRGYFDIAYNFAVDAFGRIWEARAGGIDEAVIGAHAGGYNAVSTGMVVLGSFMSVAPAPAAIAALEQLLAWKLALHGVPALGRVTVEVNPSDAFYTPFAPGAHVSLPRVAGHRDGDQTSCPGNVLYARLPAIRPRVARLASAGTPARLSIAAPVPAHPPGTPVTVTGSLTDVATGAPLAGAPLEIQQITGTDTETTIATVNTDGDGGWTYTATPAANTLLRALHRDAPASVSDIVVLAVAPVLTLTVQSAAPLTVTGTVAPPGPRVTIDVYRIGAGGRRTLVASKRLAAAGGVFNARIRRPRPGRYVLVARTDATARLAAGESSPASVVVPVG